MVEALTKQDDGGADISASGVVIVFLLVTAGAMTHYGAFKWHGLLLMVAGVGLCFRLHLRSGFRPVPVDALLLGVVLAFLAAIAYMPAGQNEVYEKYFIHWGKQTLPMKQVNVFGRAIHLLAAMGFVAALSYPVRKWDRKRWVAPARFAALLIVALAFRPLMLKSSPVPRIDVFVSQTAGAKGVLLELTPESGRATQLKLYAGSPAEAWTLRNSRNVYSMVFPSPYWDEQRMGSRLDEGGGCRKGAWFDHYGYPPATLYANAASWWAFKDVRAGWLICDLIAALCIYLVALRVSPGPKRRSFRELVTLCFLFMPRSLFVLEQSWTEPLVLASLGILAVLLTRSSGPLARGLAMGLWFSSKQYVVLAAPLLLKLRRCRLAAWVVGAAVGVALVAPFALWNWDAVFHDVLGFFLKSEGRPDALSIYGAVKRYGYEIPWWVVTPLWVGAVAFFTWKMKRTLAGMLFSTASVWLFFFLLGKQAFMNYWHLILYTLLLAVAATAQRGTAAPAESSRS